MPMSLEEKLAAAEAALGGSQSADPQVSTAYDILRSIGTGLRDAAEGTIGTPQDLASLAGQGVGWATGTRQDWDIPYLPSTDEVNQATSQYVGPSYEPQTTAGKYGRTMSSFLPMFVNPTGGVARVGTRLLRNAGESVVAGGASEKAGEMTEGTKYEPLARTIAGVGGGAYAGAVPKIVEGSLTAGGRRAEAAAEDAARRHGVNLTKGERTGDISQQMAEQQMLHGARGSLAQRMMGARRQENLSAIKESGEGFIDTAAPARGADPVQSGGLLNEQTRNRAEGLMDAGGQKIQGAIDEGVIVDAQRLRDMPGELESKLTGPDEFIPDVTLDANTPMASKAKAQIDKFVTKFNDPNVIEDSLSSVERLRRTIGNMQAVTPEDKRAMGKLMASFDDWYDDVISNDATVATTTPGVASGRTPDEVLADLKAGRSEFKKGADITRPRGQPEGGRQVADIGTTNVPEETARLFRPNDAGNLSTTAIKTINRLVEVGADARDLDQVRHIVLDQIMQGDPGKVATRVENFIARNPTAANKLFTPDQMQAMKDWAATNRKLVPDKKAINPPQSSYGIIKEIGSAGTKAAIGQGTLVGSVLGGIPGAIAGGGIGAFTAAVKTANEAKAAKQALKPADRRSVSQFALEGAAGGGRRATKGATQAAQTMTIDIPGDPNNGEEVRILEYSPTGKPGVHVRLRNGEERIIGEKALR